MSIKNFFITAAFLLLSLPALSQISLNYGAGLSFNGSGDTFGHMFETGISFNNEERLSYDIRLLHNSTGGEIPLYYIDNSIERNSSYRQINSGTILDFGLRLNFFRKKIVSPYISAGPALRYTSSNNFRSLGTYRPLDQPPFIRVELIDQPISYLRPGFKVGFGVNIWLNNRSGINLGVSLYDDFGYNSIWNLPVSYVYKF